MASSNYVLCCWSGPRRGIDPRRDKDPAIYLRSNIASLRRLAHDLSQITVVIPENPSEPKAFASYVEQIPAHIGSTKVVVVRRPNVGMSYGSFSDVYGMYRTTFDYYFFVEDDYVFAVDHFDRLHIEELEKYPKCGYVCGVAMEAGFPLHAAMSVGCFRTKALERVYLMNGCVPHSPTSEYRDNEARGQIGQSQALVRTGYTLRDWSGKYRVYFREAVGTNRLFHGECKETILEPV